MSKYRVCIFQILFWLSFIILATTIFGKVYIIEWLMWASDTRLSLAIVIMITSILNFKKKYIAAWLMNVGYVIGIAVGQIMGDIYYAIDRAEYYEYVNSKAPEANNPPFPIHHGVFIWMMVFVCFTVAGCVAEAIKKKHSHVLHMGAEDDSVNR